MRQQCEIEMTRAADGAWCAEGPGTSGGHEQIDLDRVVWDPEYRDQVLESMRAEG